MMTLLKHHVDLHSSTGVLDLHLCIQVGFWLSFYPSERGEIYF